MTQGPILIVEDDPSLQSMLVEVLEEAGYHTVATSNGADGVAAVDLLSPRLVLLDLNLPVVDGPTVLAEMRQRGTNVPVLLVTADTNGALRCQRGGEGVVGIVPKPFDLDSLLMAIEVVMNPSA